MFTSDFIFIFQKKNSGFKVSLSEWLLLYGGAFLIFVTFIWDYTKILIENHLVTEYLTWKPMPVLEEIVQSYIPQEYLWGVFGVGVFCFLGTLILLILDIKRLKVKANS